MADQDNGPQQIDTPPYPGTTRIENGQAFDVAGKALGAVDDNGKASGAAPAFNFGFKPAAQPSPAPAAGGFDFGFKPAEEKPEESWWQQNIAGPFSNDVHRIKNAILENTGPGWLPYDVLTKMGVKKDTTGPFAGIDWNKEILKPAPATDAEAEAAIKNKAVLPGTTGGYVPKTLDEAKKGIDYLRSQQRAEQIFSHEYEAKGENRLISPERLMTGQEAKDHPVLYGLLHFTGQLTTEDNAMIMAGTSGLGFVGEAAAVSPQLGVLAKTVAATPRLVSAYFAGQMAIGAGQQIPGLYEAKKDYDAAVKAGDMDAAARIKWDATVHATESAAMGYASYAAAYHAATGKPEPVASYAAESTKETLGAMADTAQTMGENAAAGVKAGAKAVKQTVGQAIEKSGALIGRTNDFETAVMRAAKVTPKRAEEIKQTIGDTKEDLQAIVNANPDIESPKDFADAIERHIQQNEANMQREAGATKDENVPVHPDFRGRVEDRLNQFFDDNRGKFGSPEEVEQAKKDILTRVMQRDQTGTDEAGNPTYEERVPNLFESENTRQGLSNETKPQFATNAKPTTDAYKAGAAQAVSEMRDIIDGAYHERGIENVQESREKEAKLIKIEESLRDAQAKADKMGEGTIFQSLMKKIGVPSTVIAIALGHPVGGAAIGAAVLGEQIHQNLTNPNKNIARAVDLAAKNPGATATKVEINPNAPGPAPAGSVPPRPTPPPVDHATYAALSSYYGKIIGAVPYEKLISDFQNELLGVHERKATGTYTPRDAEMEPRRQAMLDKLNAAKMKQRVDAEKAAQKQVADTAKAQAKAAAEQKKADEKKAADAAAAAKVAIQTGELPKGENPHLKSLGREDESGLVSHSPAMKAHAPAMEIPGLPEGMTSQDVHLHEWAHTAIGAVDGLEPVEIRTDIHPKVEKGTAAQAVFNGASIRDKAGNIDPEALGNQEVQWLTQKMAGPASHEVFNGMSRDEIKASPTASSDFRQARAMVREVHPDFTPKQVEAVVDAAYDRAHDFLTKPHIADRIRANAAVREEGLSQTLHASHGRVTQFAEDIRNAHNEYTGTDAGPDGGGAGEGGEKAEKGPAEGEKNAGAGKERPGEGAPKPSGESAAARGGIEVKPEESEARKTPEEPLKKRFQIDVTTNGETKTEPVEAFSRKEAFAAAQKKFPAASEFELSKEFGEDIPRQEGYIIPTAKHLNTPNSRQGVIPVEKTMAHELGHYMVGHNEGMIARGVLRHTHPDMSANSNAAVSWDMGNLIDSTGRKYKTEKIPGIIRMAMGGIAADEVFSNLPREQNNNFDIGAGGDRTLATRILRAAGYQEPEVTQMLHAAIDAAKERLTQPAVSDIIQENRGVREPDLSRQYHYSGARLRAMGDEAAKRIENDRTRNNRAGIGEGGEAGGANVAGREGQAAGEVGPRVQTAEVTRGYVPPERTTGNEADDAAIKAGGGIPGGRMTMDENNHVRMFHDPTTGTTLGFSAQEQVTPEATKAKLEASRKQYGLKPEDIEQSNATKDRVSTRVPEGKEAKENPLEGEPLVVGREALKNTPAKLQQKFADTVRDYPGVKIPASVKDPQKVMDRFVSHVKDNLQFLYNQVEPEKQAANAKWYESANKLSKELAQKHGISEPQAAATIATQSPQKDWDMNVSLARRIADIYTNHQDTVTTPEMIQKGHDIVKNTGANEDLNKALDNLVGKKFSELTDPFDRAAWVRLYDEAHNPRDFHYIDPGTGENRGLRTNANGAPSKVAWGSLPQIDNALSVLKDGSRENISDRLGGMHKVRNFYNNIIDPTNDQDVTIDTHAVAAGLIQPLGGNAKEVLDNFGKAGKHTGTGVKGTYPLYAEAYRQAAKELDIKPRELQSVVWEHVRNMFPSEWKSPENEKVVKGIWQKYSDGKQNLNQTRQQILKLSEEAQKKALDKQAKAGYTGSESGGAE